MFINVFASGTNIQRIAKNAGTKKVNGYLDAAYCELEETDDVVGRYYYMLQFNGLYNALKETELGDNAFTSDNHPKWSAIWEKPTKCKDFITTTFKAMVGMDDHLASLNLSTAADEDINSIMVWTSANNNQLASVKKMVQKALPNYRIIVLSGDEGISNYDAQSMVKNEIKYAKDDGQNGIIIIAKGMGSRSFSVSEIQANVIMYDNGSIDGLSQKTARNLTGGLNWDGEDKEYGHTFSFSYDNNRCENIENLILYEAITLSRSTGISTNNALKKVAMSINSYRIDVNGDPELIKVDEFIQVFTEDENLLKIADVTVDVEGILNSNVYDTLAKIKVGKENNKKKLDNLAPKRTSKNKKDKADNSTQEEKDLKKMETLLNQAVRALNRSATTVYNIANNGDTYEECLSIIANDNDSTAEFKELYTVSPNDVLELVYEEILNVRFLDIIVENSKRTPKWFA